LTYTAAVLLLKLEYGNSASLVLVDKLSKKFYRARCVVTKRSKSEALMAQQLAAVYTTVNNSVCNLDFKTLTVSADLS
jgi:hypothetical protein